MHSNGVAEAIRRAARRIVLLQRVEEGDVGDIETIIELVQLAREDQQHLQAILVQAHANLEWQLAAASLSLDLAAEQLNLLPVADDSVDTMRAMLSRARARFDRAWLDEEA